MNRASNNERENGRNFRQNYSERKYNDRPEWKRGENLIPTQQPNTNGRRDRNLSEIVIGKVYDGVVKTRQHHGTYCYIDDFEKEGIVHFTYNAMTKKQFERGDKIKIICLNKKPYRFTLTTEYVKPLVILDLNGVLGEREPYNTNSPQSIRKFCRRPWASEFLTELSKHYEIAIWSCANNRNVAISRGDAFERNPDIQLLFEWCSDEATSLYPRTSFISTAKPLFLKELHKVWDRFPCYGPHNTVLIDNHIEKFERNLFGTSLIVPDFDLAAVVAKAAELGVADCEVDTELKPTQSLMNHLINMATQNPINIQQYILQHTPSASEVGEEDCSYFPLCYPSPPPPTDPVSAATTTTTTAAAGPDEHVMKSETIDRVSGVVGSDMLGFAAGDKFDEPHHTPQKFLFTKDENLVRTKLLMPIYNNNEKVTSDSIRQQQLPGPKALTVHRRDLGDLLGAREGCVPSVVCEKTDGERLMLVIEFSHISSNSAGCNALFSVVVFNRGLHVCHLGDVEVVLPTQLDMEYFKGKTVLDGELVSQYETNGDNFTDQLFLCFDGVLLNGVHIGNNPKLGLLGRMRLISEYISKLKALLSIYHWNVFSIESKQYFSCQNLSEVVKRLNRCPCVSSTEHSAGWRYLHDNDKTHVDEEVIFAEENRHYHLCDGLIFTPVQKTYFDYCVMKWKPVHLSTVDFALYICDISEKCKTAFAIANKSTSKVTSSEAIITGHVSAAQNKLLPLSDVSLSSGHWIEIQAHMGGDILRGRTDSVIVECRYDVTKSRWIALKIRWDRVIPNSLRTAWSNLEVVSEGVTLEELQKIAGDNNTLAPPKQEVDYDDISVDMGNIKVGDDVASHYDQVQLQRHDTNYEKDDSIAMLRKVNNWIKACFINTYTLCVLQGKAGVGNVPITDAYLDSLISHIQYRVDRQSSIVKDISTPSKKFRTKRPSRRPQQSIDVLDIACGRGGDIKKYTGNEFATIGTYFGVDISKEQIDEAKERAVSAQKKGGIKHVCVFWGDAASQDFTEELDKQADHRNSKEQSKLKDNNTAYKSDVDRIHGTRLGGAFDAAWCMFALHYFCDSEEHCSALLANVSKSLKPGGIFGCIFPNPLLIWKCLASAYLSSNRVCSVKACSSTSVKSVDEGLCDTSSHYVGYSETDFLTTFGISYFFSLGDAVQDCQEFVVPLKSLIALAHRFKLEVLVQVDTSKGHEKTPQGQEAECSFPGLLGTKEFVEKCMNVSYLSDLRHVMQVVGERSPSRVLSVDEWEAIGLYVQIVFMKKIEC